MPDHLKTAFHLQDGHVCFFMAFLSSANLHVQPMMAIRTFGFITQNDCTQFTVACIYPRPATFGTP